MEQIPKTSVVQLSADGNGWLGADWKFRALCDVLSESVITLDGRGRVCGWNKSAAELFGYSAGEAAGQDFFGLLAANQHPLEQIVKSETNGGDKYPGRRVSLMAKRKTGEEFPLEIRLIEASGPEEIGTLVIASSPASDGLAAALLQKSHERLEEAIARQQEMELAFTQRQQRDERLIWQLMHHDPLSGLPNRLLMNERVSYAMRAAEAKGQYAAMLVLGVHHFNHINDVLGHAVGDFIMTAVAAQLNDCMGPDETLARLDSTEFGVVLPGLQNPQDAEQFADRLIKAACTPITVAGHELVLSACVGISIYPGDGASSEALAKNAAAAMYQAKQDGNVGWLRYTSDHDAMVLERLSIEEDLRRALDRGEFEVFYQPQVDVRRGVISGAEALIRWRRPGYGLVPPSKFISLAEENGMIVPIGAWVLEQACAQLKAWQEGGCENLRVAVNLSARQFHQCDLGEMVEAALKKTGLAPECLELEITESMLMGNVQRGIAVLQEFKKLGVRLALDDFGTGYSSLNYLKRFPVDTLKIDQSFVKRIPYDESDAAIVRAIIALARSLRLGLVAEGVETPQQLAFMRDNCCDVVQGYLFSPPVPADEFELHLTTCQRGNDLEASRA